ncbi:hypothetical protein E2C01_087717 [Portunus trituberculatus]|uniref:Uncharacterized protein n=1 Tax=Portunus trituberculatus TaxID=210409 RepID=A0A5B7JI17_PORTR|nr:hypothetical protein [Portunus trituberculatus]
MFNFTTTTITTTTTIIPPHHHHQHHHPHHHHHHHTNHTGITASYRYTLIFSSCMYVIFPPSRLPATPPRRLPRPQLNIPRSN